jgi:hypothetical protein
MKPKFFLTVAVLVFFGRGVQAQTIADFGAVRVTTDDTTTGGLLDPAGAFINFGSTRFFRPVFIEGAIPTDNQLNQPSGIFFRTRYDSNTGAGVAPTYQYIGINGRLTAITSGELRLYLNSNNPGPTSSLSDGDWFITPVSFLAHAPQSAYSGRVSNANEGLIRYDRTAQAWQVSTNGTSWASLLKTGATGVVTSVGLSIAPGTLYTVSGSPVTSAGTLTATLNTQAANTAFRGPTTGTAAQPTFRAMVAADIPNGLVTFAHWASNSCADTQIPKWNATAAAWQCAADNTSVGGTAWVTGGHVGTGIVGTTDAAAFDFRTNNVSRSGFSADGAQYFTGIATASAPAVSAASTGRIFYDSTLQQFRMSQNAGAYVALGGVQSVALTAPTGFAVSGSPVTTSGTLALAYSTHTWVQWSAKQATQPTTNYATFTTAAIWEGTMPEEWDGGTFEIMWAWAGATATTNNTVWECAVERDDPATVIGSDSWGTTTTTTSTVLGTSGELKQNTCSMSTAGLRDNLLAGEPFRIRLRRLGTNVNDTMVGDAQVAVVQIRHP